MLRKKKYFLRQTPHEPRTLPAGWDALERGGSDSPVEHFDTLEDAKAWLHGELDENSRFDYEDLD